MIGNMLERCATVHHHVKDTSKRPYVTGSANLLSDKRREKAECRVGSITSRCSRTERALLGKGQDRTDRKGGGGGGWWRERAWRKMSPSVMQIRMYDSKTEPLDGYLGTSYRFRRAFPINEIVAYRELSWAATLLASSTNKDDGEREDTKTLSMQNTLWQISLLSSYN